MIKFSFKLFLTALLCWMKFTAVYALEGQFHGYISQGMVTSRDNPFYVNETGTHFDYREIGLNGSFKLDDDLRLAGQILSRKAGDLDDGDPKLDFLLLDYNYYIANNRSYGIRVGRVKNPYGIYNTTRDVPHVRPGVFVPQSVYFETFRDALLSVDGANLYFNGVNPIGDISLDLYAGVTKVENQAVEYQIYQKDITGEFKDVDAAGLKLSLIPQNLSDLTLAVSLLDISMDLQGAPTFTPMQQMSAGAILATDPTAFTDYITSQHIDAFLTLFSLQYNWQDWIFSAEHLTIRTKISDFEILHQPAQSENSTSKAYYLQAEWIGSEKFSIYTRYENLYYNSDDKFGTKFSAHTGGNPVTQYTEAKTLGTRWYFTPDLSLTGEFSRNQGAAFINGLTGVEASQIRKNWDLYILQLSYHF
jgi:hypothetical protein